MNADINNLPVDIDLDIDPLSPPSSVLPPLKTYSRIPKNKQLEEESDEYEDIDIVLPKPKRGRPPKKKYENHAVTKDVNVKDQNNTADLQESNTTTPKPRRGRPKKNLVLTEEVNSSGSGISLSVDNGETPRRASLRKRIDTSKTPAKTAVQNKTSTPVAELDLTQDPQRTSTPIENNAEYQCETCPRVFKSYQGVRIHSAACRKNTPLKTFKKEVVEENTQEIIIPDLVGDLAEDVISNTVENLVANNQGNNVNDTFSLENNINKDYSISLDSNIVDSEVGADKCHCCGEDLQTAHSGGEFQCADCLKLFKLKSSLERHRRVVHNEGETFECPECNARCPDKGTLARHMYTHTGLKPYSCPICKKEFSRKYHLVRHNMQTGCDGSERPVFPCQVCGRIFNRKDNLREHLRAHAGQTKRKKKYNCEFCSKEFLGTTLLHIHKRSHTGEKPYGCDFCTKSFPSSGAMKKHRRKHTGERPYECKQCLARFAAKETLNRHMRTHTGVKPHSCQYCGKSFIQASQLRAHIFHHSGLTVEGENGFTCKICGKAFNRRTRLQLHVKYVHEGAIPFTCETCNKTFVRKEDLARHHILHSGIKAHKCPICEKCFAMKSSLKIHLLTHTKEPPRSCDECGRAFIRQDCLLRHMRTKHRDMLEEIMAEAEKKKLQQQLLAAANEAALELPDPDEPKVLTEEALAEAIKELLTLLVDETTLKAFGFPDAPVDCLLEAVIRRCSHQPAGYPEMLYGDRLRENAKLLFTVVIDDSAVKTLLNNQTVDEVILHVLRLAKS